MSFAGYFEFKDVCGEDRVSFEVKEENQGFDDRLILDYLTRASVSDYHELVGESTSC